MLQYVAVARVFRDSSFAVAMYITVCCSMLQCVALWCSMLHFESLPRLVLCRGRVCCSVLQYIAVCCSVLYYVAVARVFRDSSFAVAKCVAVCCSILQCVAVCCSMSQSQRLLRLILCRGRVCCSVLQCVAVSTYCFSMLQLKVSSSTRRLPWQKF